MPNRSSPRLLLFVLGCALLCAFLLWPRLSTQAARAAPAGPNYASILEPLGKAYAQDYQLPFVRVQATVAGKVATPADRAKWAGLAEKTLALGYVPAAKRFEAVPLTALKGVMQLQMAGNRTPEQTARSVMAPGNVIVQATWSFGDAKPVRSYAVFSSKGEVLFDTLISMPVVYGPMFSRGH